MAGAYDNFARNFLHSFAFDVSLFVYKLDFMLGETILGVNVDLTMIINN